VTSPLLSHECRFDGQQNWVRLEFEEPVELRMRDRGSFSNREAICEDEVRVNGRRGGKVHWLLFRRENQSRFFLLSGTALSSGGDFDVDIPLKWGWMNLADGTYIVPEHASLPIRASDPERLELRVWRVSAKQLPGLREREPRSGPISHSDGPDHRLELDWSETSRWIDLRDIVQFVRGILYLELWSGSDWLDARWVDTSGLGTTLFHSGEQSMVLAWELQTGRGLSDCGGLRGQNGLYYLDHTPQLLSLPSTNLNWAVLKCEDIEVCLPWAPPRTRSVTHHVLRLFTDRTHYQKGETVGFCGWFRSRQGFTNPYQESPAGKLHYAVSYREYGYGKVPRPGPRGKLSPTPQGGFHGEFTIEAASDRETLWLEVAATDPEGHKALYAESVNHRKIEYPETGCRLHIDENEARFSAFFATGEPLVGLPVQLTLTTDTPLHNPPGFPGYQFHAQEERRSLGSTPRSVEGLETDTQGRCSVALPSLEVLDRRSRRWQVRAQINPPDGRGCAAAETLLLKPQEGLFVGMRAWGETVLIVVSDAAGRQVPGCTLKVWAQDTQLRQFTTRGEPLLYDWSESGLLHAEASDHDGLTGVSTLLRAEPLKNPCRSTPFAASLHAHLDKKVWLEDETALLHLFHDGGPAFAMVEVHNGELLQRETRQLHSSDSTWQIPLDRRSVGLCRVRVELNTQHGRRSLDTHFRVTPACYELDVKVTCQDASVAHGESTKVLVSVKTPTAQPANGADVMLFVVDKGALRVSGSGLTDPIKAFYDNVSPQFSGSSSLDRSVHCPERRAADERLLCSSPGPGPAGDPSPTSPCYRESGEPLVYSGSHSTDESGNVSIDVTMKGAPGDYAVIAMAAHNWSDFGRGETNLVCQQPAFTLRMTHPDYLWRGDQFDLGVRVQNLQGQAQQVRVYTRGSNLEPAQTGHRVTLQASDSELLTIGFEGRLAGPAGVQVALEGQEASDRFQFRLPVYDLEIPRNWCEWGVLSAQEPLHIPLAMDWAAELQLEVWAENPHMRLFHTLSDREDHLNYILQRVVAYLWAGDYRRQVFQEKTQSGHQNLKPLPDLETSIRALLALQDSGGTFSNSAQQPEHKADFYITLIACRALWEARSRGLQVPDSCVESTLGYLRGRIPDEYKRAQETSADPWQPLHSDMLEEMGLPSKRSHPLQKAAVFPTGQCYQLVSSSGTQGGWTMIDTRWEKRPSLFGIVRLARQLDKTPYQDPRGVFRFGTASKMFGELGLSGDATKASRWGLPRDLHHLDLRLEGEGNLFYSLTARGTERPDSRTPGYGLVSRTVNRQPPDESGEWHLKVDSRVEVNVKLDLKNTYQLECFQPKPAAFLDKSEKQILHSDRGYSGFDFRFEARHRGRFVFPPAWVSGPKGVIARTDWHTLVVE
jgi:hypothetical protein